MTDPMLRAAYNGKAPADRPDLQRIANEPDGKERLRLVKEAEATAKAQPPTLKDAKPFLSAGEWIWPGWIREGSMTCVAAREGVGKTRFLMWLTRLLWLGEPWPDGSPNTNPRQSKTLWLPFDSNIDQLCETAERFGVPLDMIALGADRNDPVTPWDIDEPDAIDALDAQVKACKPRLMIIDTITYATSRDINRANEAKEAFGPLMRLARDNRLSVVVVSHLSAQGEPLGRRIKGAARTVIKIDEPDPEHQPGRLSIHVDKSAWAKPKRLGASQDERGFTFDSNPPRPLGGRPPVKRTECAEWLKERLSVGPYRVADLRKEAEAQGWTSKVLYAAKDAIGANEMELDNRKYWEAPTDD